MKSNLQQLKYKRTFDERHGMNCKLEEIANGAKTKYESEIFSFLNDKMKVKNDSIKSLEANQEAEGMKRTRTSNFIKVSIFSSPAKGAEAKLDSSKINGFKYFSKLNQPDNQNEDDVLNSPLKRAIKNENKGVIGSFNKSLTKGSGTLKCMNTWKSRNLKTVYEHDEIEKQALSPVFKSSNLQINDIKTSLNMEQTPLQPKLTKNASKSPIKSIILLPPKYKLEEKASPEIKGNNVNESHFRLNSESQENLLCDNLSEIRADRNSKFKFDTKDNLKLSLRQKNIWSIETQDEKNWDEIINTDFEQGRSKNCFQNRSLRKTVLVYDSLSDHEDENEVEDSKGRRSISIHPHSIMAYYVKIMITVCLIICLTNLPYRMAFEAIKVNSPISFFWLIIDLMIFIEFISTFFIGFFEEDEIIFSFKYIALNYTMFGSFFMDIVVIIPVSSIIFIIQSNYPCSEVNSSMSYSSAVAFLQNAKWIRMLALFKLWNLIDFILFQIIKLEEYGEQAKKLIILKVVAFFFLALHIISCFWIFIGFSNREMRSSWIYKSNYDDESEMYIYFSSLYYNMATILSIGYGDIIPVCNNERLYICILMFISTHFYSLIISRLSNVIYEKSKKDEVFFQNQNVLKRILSEYNISKPLEKQLQKSLIFIKKNYLKDKHNLLDSLPERLKNILYKKIYQNRIGELDFFKGTSNEFIMYCTPKIQLVVLKKREILVSIGDIFTELYMVNTGILNFYLGSIFNNFRINSIGKGHHFGDVNMYLNERSEYTIKSATLSTEIFTLKKSSYSELKINFPDIVESIIKKSIDNFTNLELLRRNACTYFDQQGTMTGFRLEASHKIFESQIAEMNSEEKNNISDLYNALVKNEMNVKELTELLNENEPIQPKPKLENKIASKSSNIEDLRFKNNELINAFSMQSQGLFDLTKLKSRKSVLKCEIQQPKKKSNFLSKIIIDVFSHNKCNLELKSKKIYKEDNLKKQFVRKINLGTQDEIQEKPNKLVLRTHKYYIEDISSVTIYTRQQRSSCSLKSNFVVSADESGHQTEYFQKESQIKSTKATNQGLRIINKAVSSTKQESIIQRSFSTCERPKLNSQSTKRNKSSATFLKKNFTSSKKLKYDTKQSMKTLDAQTNSNFENDEQFSQYFNSSNDESQTQDNPNKFKSEMNIMTTSTTCLKPELSSFKSSNRKLKFLELNKQEMMKDFGRKIDKNAFYENNINIYEGYLKSLINFKKGAAASKHEASTHRRATDQALIKVESNALLSKKTAMPVGRFNI